jgi:signal transduction histidine kinase
VLREDRLSDVLSEFARTLATDFPIQGILDHLVHRIVDVLPVDAAGVTLISPGSEPRFVAASDERALEYENLQSELAQGPCLAAYRTDGPISIPDLAEDHRFPLFAEHALEAGLVAVFSFPLRDGDRGLGALDLYRDSAGPLDEPAMAAAQTLADVATAYLLNAQARADLEAVSATERAASEKLRVVDRTRTEFLATVIHELRTPLTSISGYTEMLQDERLGDLNPTQRRLVAAIVRNSERLTMLANDLLALAKLDQGAVPVDHTDVDLGAVVLTARHALQALLDDRQLEVTFEVPATPLMITGDPRHLERLVSNLLTNALKFTEDGGWVRCTLTRAGDCARLEVADNGIGIPEAEQGDLFTRFFRASTAHQRAPGSGLGLSIVQSIVHNHGGTVSFRSAPEVGTSFVVLLPRTPPAG